MRDGTSRRLINVGALMSRLYWWSALNYYRIPHRRDPNSKHKKPGIRRIVSSGTIKRTERYSSMKDETERSLEFRVGQVQILKQVQTGAELSFSEPS